MQDRIARERAAQIRSTWRHAQAAGLARLALCALVGGCSSFTVEAPLLVTDPGKFQYHNCDQLNEAARSAATRARDMKALMEKADQGIAGPLVGAMAYRADYISANEDLRQIEDTAH